MLRHFVIDCPAYMSLKPTPRALIVELYRLYRGNNNGELHLSVRKAAEALNVTKDTAAKAFKALIERGFVRPRWKGSFQTKQRHATTWILTEFEYRGEAPTKDFLSWTAATGKSKSRSQIFGPTVRKTGTDDPELDALCAKFQDRAAKLPRRNGPEIPDTSNHHADSSDAAIDAANSDGTWEIQTPYPDAEPFTLGLAYHNTANRVALAAPLGTGIIRGIRR